MPGSPTYTIGQLVTSSDINNWFITDTQARSATQSVTSSTALVNDDTLSASVIASATYHVEAFLIFTGGTQGSSDLKIAWTAPAGVTMTWWVQGLNTAGTYTVTAANVLPTTTVALGTSGATVRVARIEGALVVAATAGTLQLQWAQNTSSGTATVMGIGSLLKLTRVA